MTGFEKFLDNSDSKGLRLNSTRDSTNTTRAHHWSLWHTKHTRRLSNLRLKL